MRLSQYGDNMSRTIADIIISGERLNVDLLLAIPRNSSLGVWVTPGWRGYASVFGYPIVKSRDREIGLAFEIACQFLPTEGIWPIEAAGVTFDGSIIMVAPFLPSATCTSITPFPVVIRGILNAVL